MPRTSVPLGPEVCRTLLALVEAGGNATVAAARLNINQASMSKRLKPLQHASADLPRPWVEKIGKRFVLTAEGRLVLPAVRHAVEWWRDFDRFVRGGRPQGVRFACGQEAVGGFVLEAVAAFHKKSADVGLRMATLRGRERIRRVALGLLDLATVTHDAAAIHTIARRELHVEELYDDPLELVCGTRAEWAERFEQLPHGRVAARALTSFPLILPDAASGLRRAFDRLLEQAGVRDQVRVALELGGWQALEAYVRRGLGVGLLPRSVVAKHPAGLLRRDLAPAVAPPNVVRLVCRKHPLEEGELDLSDAARRFLDLLRAEAARLRPAAHS
jgi:DNA-binding transcriptional LysR family regulator